MGPGLSFLSDKPVIIVPTIASTDAPTSKLAIIYNEEGVFEEYFHLRKNPDIVLVDTGIIAEASCAEGETIVNMPFPVNPADVYAAVLTADRLDSVHLGTGWIEIDQKFQR